MKIAAILTLAAAAGLGVVPSLTAQELEAGTWTGTVTPPDGGVIDVTYEVSYEDDALMISLVPPPDVGAPADKFAFEDVKLADGVLTFGWNPGEELACELALQDDGSFAGDCVDANGSSGHLTMVPPDGDEDPDPERH